jgi:hypothetical protein
MKMLLRVLGAAAFSLLVCAGAYAQTGGIRGSVKDPSGAVVAGAKVTITAQGTGAQRQAASDRDGSFEFASVPVAAYTIEVEAAGFKKFAQKDVTVDIGRVVVVNATMQIGQTTTTVTVEAAAAQVETTSTQLGAVVNERAVTELPLNARDVYQLLQIQPGVQSQVGIDLFYGSDKPGVVSVNGGRGRSNNYSVNGGEGNDMFANLPAVQPSPDSIEEFRVLTNTFDAEYGRNSGAVVNVVTKSGTNDLHGSVYEFFRNKVLNAKGYLDSVKPDQRQNQYGATIGGPIKKDKTFIFGSYEGRRALQGISGQQVQLPSAEELGVTTPGIGDYSAQTPFGGSPSVTMATILNGRPGCATGIATLGGGPGLTAALAGNVAYWNQAPAGGPAGPAIFPTNQIPTACYDPVAVNLLRFVPAANLPNDFFQGVPNSTNNQDQFTIKLDHHLNANQQLTAYYFFEHDNNLDPFARFQAAGANIGNFGGLTDQLTQQVNISHVWTIGNSAVNEARFTYFREGQGKFNHPLTTDAVTNSCTGTAAAFCFTGQSDAPLVDSSGNCLSSNPPAPPPCPMNPSSFGITPGLGPAREGVPNIVVNGGLSIGNNFEGEFVQYGNTYQWSDSFSKVVGKHSLKFGGDVRYQQFDQTLFFDVNGQFVFGNTGIANTLASDDSYTNYLLGMADTYLQGGAQKERVRSTSVYLFAQDSWKLKPNLTLNYGLRWELNTPLADIGHKVQTFRPGQTSTQYPCGNLTPAEQATLGAAGPNDCAGAGVTPVGLVVPGDTGVPSGLTQTYYRAFAPRIGLAWSPGWTEGWLRTLTGGPGKTSVRMGYGIFYNPVEQLVLEQFSAEPPFGGSSTFYSVLLQTPFVGQNGNVSPNPFGGILNPPVGQPTDFARFRPMLLYGALQPHIRPQYAEQYNLTIQRELPGNMLFQIAYVGSQGHRLFAIYDFNHGNPQTCLDLLAISDANPANVLDSPGGSPLPCGQLGADSEYFIPGGTTLPNDLHLPYSANGGGPVTLPANSVVGASGITLVGLRRYSSPLCDPLTGASCPADGVPVFSNIFTEDSVANSNYNSLQVLVEKHYSHGLQLQGAYTFSKSIDNASSFENALNPVNFSATRGLSMFDARHRFVLSYFWEFPVPKMEGFAGKVLNGWASSGIATFQTGFPIRITTGTTDNELFSSLDFEAPGEPNLVASFHTQNPKTHGNLFFDPSLFNADAWDPSSGLPQPPGTVPLGSIGNAPRTLCCGPGINNFDISFLKNTQLGERVRMEFRAEFFNIFNHTQFIGVQGDISEYANNGAPFGSVLRTRAPRQIQFAVKFIF